MQTETPRFKAWLRAEKEATAAERELHAAMLAYAKHSSGRSPDALAVSAEALRMKAHGLFEEAMQELKDIAASIQHREVQPGDAPQQAQPGS